MPLSSRRHRHVLSSARVVLVRPRFPENFGAVARAMRVTGFEDLWTVAPEPLVHASHEHARRLAVGAVDLLDSARVVESLDDALEPASWVVGTTARAGVRGVLSPRQTAQEAADRAANGQLVIVVFGGERHGLRRSEVLRCDRALRIPMVGNEPSLNLAQAVMIVLYELMVEALTKEAARCR